MAGLFLLCVVSCVNKIAGAKSKKASLSAKHTALLSSFSSAGILRAILSPSYRPLHCCALRCLLFVLSGFVAIIPAIFALEKLIFAVILLASIACFICFHEQPIAMMVKYGRNCATTRERI